MSGFSDRMREARLNGRLSQRDVARRLGVSSNAVRQWEAGRTVPGRISLEQLAEALDVTPDWLGGVDDGTRAGPTDRAKPARSVKRRSGRPRSPAPAPATAKRLTHLYYVREQALDELALAVAAASDDEGVTRGQIAEMLGVSRSVVQDWVTRGRLLRGS